MKNQISNSWCSYAKKAPQKKVNESYPKYKFQISLTFFKACFLKNQIPTVLNFHKTHPWSVVRWPSLSASPPTTFSRSPGLGIKSSPLSRCQLCGVKKRSLVVYKGPVVCFVVVFWGLIVEFEATCRFLLKLKRQKLTKYMKEHDIRVGLVCFPYLEIKSSF